MEKSTNLIELEFDGGHKETVYRTGPVKKINEIRPKIRFCVLNPFGKPSFLKFSKLAILLPLITSPQNLGRKSDVIASDHKKEIEYVGDKDRPGPELDEKMEGNQVI